MTYDTAKYNFSLVHTDGTAISVCGNKEGITEVLEDFKTFLLACGYHHKCVDDIILDDTRTP